MTIGLPLSDEQRDCLQELTNVAMGAAAEALADLTQHFICLPIPIIRYIDQSALLQSFGRVENGGLISLISQDCTIGGIDCRAVVVVSDNAITDLARFRSQTIDSDDDAQNLLQQLFAAVSDICFDRLSTIFDMPITRGEMISDGLHRELKDVVFSECSHSKQMVTVEINYSIENHPFHCDLLLSFPDKALPELVSNLDRLLH
jgi:chemotaxis protein CheY-P-specific phosphatase CheC